MREVRTCDFCGEDATGAFEPYPSSMPDGPRLLLCDDCRDRLASIVEPLVARVESEETASGRESAPASPEPDRGGDGPDRSTPGTGADDASSAPSGGEAPADDDPRSAVGDSTDAGGRSTSERAGTPPNYRKVMRFLENRQLPIEREEAERLAAEAYDLDTETVADAIDHAVSYGRLREVSGELKR